LLGLFCVCRSRLTCIRSQGAELGRLLVAAIPYVPPECVHDVEVCVTAVVLALPQTSAQRVALVSLLFSTVSGILLLI
jgi:hypothetical protein